MPEGIVIDRCLIMSATESPCDVSRHPKPNSDNIFTLWVIQNELNKYDGALGIYINIH